MMPQVVPCNAHIRADAVFYNGKKKPVWFGLEGERYDEKELCYAWKSSEGMLLS